MGEFPLLYAVLQYMILHSDSIQILLYQIETDFVTWVSIAVIRLLKVETILSLSTFISFHIYIHNHIYIYIFMYTLYYIYTRIISDYQIDMSDKSVFAVPSISPLLRSALGIFWRAQHGDANLGVPWGLDLAEICRKPLENLRKNHPKTGDGFGGWPNYDGQTWKMWM